MAFIRGLLIGISMLWWLLLSSGISLVCARATPNALRWVNRAFGVAALASLVSI